MSQWQCLWRAEENSEQKTEFRSSALVTSTFTEPSQQLGFVFLKEFHTTHASLNDTVCLVPDAPTSGILGLQVASRRCAPPFAKYIVSSFPPSYFFTTSHPSPKLLLLRSIMSQTWRLVLHVCKAIGEMEAEE